MGCVIAAVMVADEAGELRQTVPVEIIFIYFTTKTFTLVNIVY